MSIATKTGDDGTTALMFGRRVRKNDVRVEAYGTVDELNAALGVVRASCPVGIIAESLLSIQHELVLLMGELAVGDEDIERYIEKGYKLVQPEMVDRISEIVTRVEKDYHISYQGWATPGATPVSANLDVARTVCRRAERRCESLKESGQRVNPDTIRYLNRLSDLLWLFARLVETQSAAN